MKCIKCGCEFSIGLFCPECGTKYDEAEVKKAEEKKMKALEAERQEEIKKQEEIRKQQEIQREEEKQQRELEFAKAKVEQERLAKERAESEIELLKQRNEKIRIEQELAAQREAAERQKADELSRTFNGHIYDNVDEMLSAKENFEKEELKRKQANKINKLALGSMLLGIATYPLVLTGVLWLPAVILSIILGVMALKGKTEKRGIAIAGIVLAALFVVIVIVSIIMSLAMG